MLNPPLFVVSAFGRPIQVSATTDAGLEILNQGIFPTLPRSSATELGHALRISLIEGGIQPQLLVNDVPVAVADHPAELVPLAIQHVDEAIIRNLTGLRAVHAGAVQVGGDVLLLPGRSHAGKSSLVAELLRRGAIYFSDEYALIDAEGHVHPYPRPLLVRNGRPQQVPRLPGEFGAEVASAPAPVRWIVELEYREKTEWRVAPVPQSYGLMILLQHTPHDLAETPDLIEKFQRAVAGARCYSGKRTDAVEAADRILQMLG